MMGPDRMTLDDMTPPCWCGSGKPRRALIDARGIFCCYCCSSCEAEKRGRYRPEIFADAAYEADEPIEAD